MKALAILSLVQTALLILLFGRVLSLEGQLPMESPMEQPPSANVPLYSQTANDYSGEAYWSIDEVQLRNIIREELGTYSGVAASADGNEPQARAADFATTTEKQYQFDSVSQRIEYFASVGRISDSEMQVLQMEIANLDQANRPLALRKLTQALNSGAIEGRF